MKEKDILRLYSSWAGIPIQNKLSGIPIGNLDVFEDDRRLENHLFYLMTDTASGRLRCFFYFEDNLFVKSINGELTLSLREQLNILDGYFVGYSLEFKAHRLRRTKQVLSEEFLFSAESGQRQTGGKGYGTLCVFSALLDLSCNGCKGKQVIIVVLCFIPQNRLPAGSAHIKLPTVFQRVLQGVGFMAVNSDTGWKRKMPCLDGVIAVVDSDVHGF